MKPCVQCGRAVEERRECYALPTCYACLPPPEPLPVARPPRPVFGSFYNFDSRKKRKRKDESEKPVDDLEDAQETYRETLVQMARSRRGSPAQQLAGRCLREAMDAEGGDWRLARVYLTAAFSEGTCDVRAAGRADALLADAGVPAAFEIQADEGTVTLVPEPAAPARRVGRVEDRMPPPAYRCPMTLTLPLGGATNDTGGAA